MLFVGDDWAEDHHDIEIEAEIVPLDRAHHRPVAGDSAEAVVPAARWWWSSRGAKGTRTPDPLLAKQVLYQLSYSPRNLQVRRPRLAYTRRIKLNARRTATPRGCIDGLVRLLHR